MAGQGRKRKVVEKPGNDANSSNIVPAAKKALPAKTIKLTLKNLMKMYANSKIKDKISDETFEYLVDHGITKYIPQPQMLSIETYLTYVRKQKKSVKTQLPVKFYQEIVEQSVNKSLNSSSLALNNSNQSIKWKFLSSCDDFQRISQYEAVKNILKDEIVAFCGNPVDCLAVKTIKAASKDQKDSFIIAASVRSSFDCHLKIDVTKMDFESSHLQFWLLEFDNFLHPELKFLSSIEHKHGLIYSLKWNPDSVDTQDLNKTYAPILALATSNDSVVLYSFPIHKLQTNSIGKLLPFCHLTGFSETKTDSSLGHCTCVDWAYIGKGRLYIAAGYGSSQILIWTLKEELISKPSTGLPLFEPIFIFTHLQSTIFAISFFGENKEFILFSTQCKNINIWDYKNDSLTSNINYLPSVVRKIESGQNSSEAFLTPDSITKFSQPEMRVTLMKIQDELLIENRLKFKNLNTHCDCDFNGQTNSFVMCTENGLVYSGDTSKTIYIDKEKHKNDSKECLIVAKVDLVDSQTNATINNAAEQKAHIERVYRDIEVNAMNPQVCLDEISIIFDSTFTSSDRSVLEKPRQDLLPFNKLNAIKSVQIEDKMFIISAGQAGMLWVFENPSHAYFSLSTIDQYF